MLEVTQKFQIWGKSFLADALRLYRHVQIFVESYVPNQLISNTYDFTFTGQGWRPFMFATAVY